MPTITVANIVDAARIRHWSFVESQLSDGAAILWLNMRQRHLLLEFRDTLRGLVGSNVETATVVDGILVGIDADGNPYYITTAVDGYSLAFDENGVPYINVTAGTIATDPFGQNGGTPGFPLPPDALVLIGMSAILSDDREIAVTIVDETERLIPADGRRLPAFVGANRVVPIRQTPKTSNDLWDQVASVRLSYLGLPTLETMSDELVMPAPLHEPLVAGMADLFAKQSKDCTAAERAAFARDAKEAEDEIRNHSFDSLRDMVTSSVIFKG